MYILKKIKTFTIGASDNKQINKISIALHFIETNAVRSFSSVALIKSIIVRPTGSYDNMLFPEEGVYVCEPKTILESSSVYLASLFIHEGVHMLQWKQGRKYIGDSAERDAYKVQRNFLKKFGDKSEVAWLDKCLEEQWWKKNKGIKKETNFVQSDQKLIRFCKRYIEGRLCK